MVKMPTGEEAPAGFEKLYAAYRAVPGQEDIRIDFVTVSQLSSGEMAELENMFHRADDYITELTGNKTGDETFRDWMNFTPGHTTISDKLIFRAFSGRYLTGYAQVITGLFALNEWTILTLMLDPSFRLQGIETGIVDKVEQRARDAKAAAVNYIAVPTGNSTPNFWESAGYTDIINRFDWTIGSNSHEVLVYRKELAD